MKEKKGNVGFTGTCGYCFRRSEDLRSAFLKYGPRKKDRYQNASLLCPECRVYLRRRFAY